MKECLIISLILKVQWHEIFQERSKDRVNTKRLQYNCNPIPECLWNVARSITRQITGCTGP
jgi:hypothetical protein